MANLVYDVGECVSIFIMCPKCMCTPFLQCRECVTLNFAPHAHVSAVLVGSPPYLKIKPSLNSDLFSLKVYLFSGKALNQVETPFERPRELRFHQFHLGINEVCFLSVCFISFQFFDLRTNFFLLCCCVTKS